MGEGLLGRRTLRRQIAGTLIGTIAFRLLVAAAVAAGLPGDALKLATAVDDANSHSTTNEFSTKINPTIVCVSLTCVCS